VVVALAVTAVLLALHEVDAESTPHPVLLAPAAWLLLAPTTLPWLDDPPLGPYQAGVTRAAAAGVLAVAVPWVLRWWHARQAP
jgi:hypothetical protein